MRSYVRIGRKLFIYLLSCTTKPDVKQTRDGGKVDGVVKRMPRRALAARADQEFIFPEYSRDHKLVLFVVSFWFIMKDRIIKEVR